MAITRTQIAKQLLANGGRIGLRFGNKGPGQSSREAREARDARDRGMGIGGKQRSGPSTPSGVGGNRNGRDPMAQFTPESQKIARQLRNQTMGAGDKFIPDIFPITKGLANFFQVSKPTPFDIQRKGLIKALGPQTINMTGADRSEDTPLWAQLGYSSEEEYLAALARAQAPSITEQEPEEEDEGLRLAFRANGGRIGFRGGDAARSDAASGRNAGRADPGGGVERGGGDRDRRRVEQYTKPPTTSGGGDGGVNQKPPVVFNLKKGFTQHNINNQKLKDAVALGLITNDEYNILGGYDVSQTMGMGPVDTAVASGAYNLFQSALGPKLNPNPQPFSEIFGDVKRNVQGASGLSEDLKAKYDNIMSMSSSDLVAQKADQKVAQMAEGGIMNPDIIGGEMDFESARQMYGLGKLVKKVTRTVKKIAKSPIGKAALLYTGAGGLGNLAAGQSFFSNFARPGFLGNVGSIFGKGGLENIMAKARLGKFVTSYGDQAPIFEKNILGKALTSPFGLITAASALAGLLTPEQEEEAQQLARGEGIDIEEARRSILNSGTSKDQRALAFRAEGGPAEGKEPVAKKTMPLLDMGGKEMDLRAEGGFVPIGRMEKADDVPARLSKNEFVFTADAVRNAGDGDVDKGAEVMYNMMKNLEAGGDVSEESQGLEGARRMFQTSQRLEEVL